MQAKPGGSSMAIPPSDDSGRDAADSGWEARFRAPAIRELDQLTHEPTGRILAELSPDGRWACYLQDVAGNELGHFVALPTDGGPEVDLTPGFAPYAGELLAFSRRSDRVAFVTASDDTFTARVGRLHGGRFEDLRAVHTTRAALTALCLSADGRILVLSSGHRSVGLEFSLLTVDVQTGDPGPELW